MGDGYEWKDGIPLEKPYLGFSWITLRHMSSGVQVDLQKEIWVIQ